MKLLATSIFVLLLTQYSLAQSCSVEGLSGNCINTDTTGCGGQLFPGYCPGGNNIVCCVSMPGCNTPEGSGTCALTSHCSGTSVPGYCPGPTDVECCVNGGGGQACSTPQGSGTCMSTSQCSGTSVPGYCPGPSDIQCCVPKGPSPGGWNRTDCLDVAYAWLKAGIKYSWSETTLQWVTSGPGPYRSDCSGFVSAAWNEPAPGYVTQDFPCYQIDASELQPCDALLNPQEHVALFIGWSSPGVPNVVEECGHTPDCCGSEATCPGSCGSSTDCNEYCPGCPIQAHAWSSIYAGFYPCRRNGW